MFWNIVFTLFVTGTIVVVAENGVKLDFSCLADYNRDWMNTLRHDCRFKTRDPLARPCTEACILRDLGFLAKALNETLVQAVSRHGTVMVTTALEDLFSDNQDLAEAVQENVDRHCSEIINTNLLVKNTTCEQWDDILTCVNEAVCNATIQYIDMYPDLRCYQGYKTGPARDDHNACLKIVKNPFTKDCHKACMLTQFRIIEYHAEMDKDPMPKLGDIGDEQNGFNGGLVGELEWRFKEGYTDQGLAIAKRIHERCSAIFRKTVLVEKKSCEDWSKFYDCITAAVNCG